MEAITHRTRFATPSGREAVLMRVFEAPRDLVFETGTNPALIPDWWGPERFSVRVDEMDVRPGGAWRFILRDNVSTVFNFYGVFQEVDPPVRLSYTFEFEGLPGHKIVDTVRFDDMGGDRTRVTFTSLFASERARDAAMRRGARDGALETAERFAKLLTRCAARPGGTQPAARPGIAR